MRRGRRRIFTAAQCAEMWRRYKAGESILGIGRALDRAQTTVHRELQYTGGIAPPERRRSSRVLSLVEREEVSRGIAAGYTIRAIARGLNRAVSTVSQEVSRHGGRELYRAAEADLAAWDSALRPKRCLLAKNRELQRIVAVKLKQDWAPQQIAGWLKDEYSGNPELWVSHETIYRSLFVQARGVLKKELIGHLREGDLVEGSRGTYIATLVERQSRFVIIVKVADKRSDVVVAALIKAVRKLPIALRRSLTWDRGTELANHAQFTVATDVQVYFCDPSSPWQRGSNENTNGLLRQYYPKRKDLSGVSQAQLDTVARKLNTRPRETLHWKTPAYILGTSVSTIH